MPTADEYWNQTYVQGMSGQTEQALNNAYNRLAKRSIEYPTDCGAICRHVHNYLSAQGVKSHILSGQFVGGFKNYDPELGAGSSRDHAWLEVDNKIVDPTAIQFRNDVRRFKPEYYVSEEPPIPPKDSF